MKNRSIIEGSLSIVNSPPGVKQQRRAEIRAQASSPGAVFSPNGERFVARFRSLSHGRCSLNGRRLSSRL
jgi:hypothetical protein